MRIVTNKLILFLFFLLFSARPIHGQKTGLVLSGGGASGIAHIGVLKALEENNIPIDYITGTSIGAFVGALYAIGYSPEQMEQLVKSEKFRTLVNGQIDSKYVFYFKNKDENASWIKFKLSLDSLIEPSFPTNIISPIPMDLALLEILAQGGAAANYNFDSLLVPFRCVASDVEAKKSVVFKKGSLNEAVRASLTYPFYLKPISVDGKLLFDGGLYNNFPSNVMYDDFYPEFIIGSNVTANAPPPNEDDIMSQVRSMLVGKTNYNVICENGVIIEPKADVALFDFDNTQELIDSGYAAAKRKIELIKRNCPGTRSKEEITAMRYAFISKQPKLVFTDVVVTGLNETQAGYVKKVLFPSGKPSDISKLKNDYFRLAADERIKSIFPDAQQKPDGTFLLKLSAKKEKDLITYFGGNFSNRPISTGFVGFKYNHLSRIATTVAGNTYFGKLYTSAQIKARLDFPFRIPFFIEPNLTYNRWDFFKSRYVFFEDVKPPYLIQKEEFGEINLGIPAKNKGRFIIGTGYANNTNSYYQTDQYSEADTADVTDFSFATTYFVYEFNNLNRKQYASEGTYFAIKTKYVQGEEFTKPGTTAIDKKKFRDVHEWFQVKINFESYYKKRGILRLGIYAENVYSTQPFFQNYTVTKLVSPAFQPTPESKTVFLENYRTHKFFSAGLKNVITVRKNIEVRIDGFVAFPYQSIHENTDLKAYYGDVFVTKHYIGMAALVYHTPVGPASISINYYDKLKNPVSFMFHFGYILFNKSAFD